MLFLCKNLEEEWDKYSKWHLWFAWYPVLVTYCTGGTCWAWLQYVERKLDYEYKSSYFKMDGWKYWEYRIGYWK